MQSTKMNIKRPVLVDELKSHQSAFLGNEICDPASQNQQKVP